MDRIPIAIVGFGRFGCLHAQRLRAHPQFDLRCVVDTNPEARASARRLGFEAVADLTDLPADVIAAAVTTPPETHAEIATDLMVRGLHVLVEKPLAVSHHGIDQLLAVQRETGRILCTGHVERFNAKRVQPCGGQSVKFYRAVKGHHSGRHAVLDLLVHDLDLIAYWLSLPVDNEIHIIAGAIRDQEVDVSCELNGLPLRLCASYGATAPRASILCGSASPAAAKVAESASLPDRFYLYGVDALTRQYSAFRNRLCDLDSPIADGLAGAAATRRALAILNAI